MSRREPWRRRIYRGMSPEAAVRADAEHREVMGVLWPVLVAMTAAGLSALIVTTALPVVIADIGGTQHHYTWLMSSAILASTAVTPIAGKLADLYNKKQLLLGAIAVFTAGTALCGFAMTPEMMIATRVLQGAGMGAIMVLTQIVIAAIVPPRQRGRYNGYIAVTMTFSTVAAPLVGGLIIEAPGLDWRWCFWGMLPLTVTSWFFLAKRLHVPVIRRENTRVDWGGAALIALAAAMLLLLVSLAGTYFPWFSWQSALMLLVLVSFAAGFVAVERRVSEPVVPLRLLTQRFSLLAIVACLAMGVVMFGANVLLIQYFQLGRGFSPLAAGLLVLPLMVGMSLGSQVTGNILTRSGRWKLMVSTGMGAMTLGLGLLALIDAGTPLWQVTAALSLVGLGLGGAIQNIVVAVQNNETQENVGAATSTVNFFRSLGGAVGVQVLGVVYAAQVGRLAASALEAEGIDPQEAGALDLSQLSPDLAPAVEQAYGDGIGVVLAVAAGLCLIGLVSVMLMPSTRLRDSL
ncbi:MFS transporter [Nesterenkonia flava]|uniref:MFS transporter n=1 Tax=Nesterenkonia flava TaxID=469799 RepID=A0ABU1FQL0_9MICC|nr:MFS transporter [Nesterenkonia flava]MDR5710884.1 MFS transporter [Nesterenkonia flava]